jgi:ABC-2 type transport system ATP-binding protein
MRDMRRLIRRLADDGMTVLLSSHLMPEVEELCNRVAIVRSGAIVYEGEIADLKRTAGATYRLRTTDDARALELAHRQRGIEFAVAGEHGVAFPAEEPDVAGLSLALGQAGVGILALTPELATLEDLFFRLTDGKAADGTPPPPGAVGPAGAPDEQRLVQAQ